MSDLSAAMNERPKEKPASKEPTALQTNQYLSDTAEGLKLLTSLVSNKNKRDKTDLVLDEIYKMIHEDFFELSRNDVSPKSAQAYKGLIDAYQDLVEICFFPAIENKHIVAVGGHFSAGKSKFLNSIIGDKRLLPIDQTPTTSIPAYILKGTNDSIFALNQYQNRVEIDKAALKVIAHDFNRTYNLSFSHLLKLITIERKDFMYNNIMFIDTPGYSKADTVKNRHSNTDENIAREHLRSADLLIWLIDIKNGTIPNEDIRFIRSLNMQQPVLFVLNKADMKIDKEIKKVVDTVRANVEKAQLPVYDVIAYSSNLAKEYSPSGSVIKKFMKEINTLKPGTDIVDKFKNVFEEFLSYHQSQKELERSTRKIINESLFDSEMKDENREALTAVTGRFKKQVDDLIKNEMIFNDFNKKLQEKVIEALKLQNIQIVEGVNISLPKTVHSKQKKMRRFRFSASVDKKIERVRDTITDTNNISGKVVKVSSALIIIKILDGIDVVVGNAEIKKQTGRNGSELFKEDMGVTVQYAGKNKAYVQAELMV